MSSTNPLDVAREIGSRMYGDIGANAYEELELAFASSLQPRFAELKRFRTWQNLAFYWQPGFHKSTIMEDFKDVLPDVYSCLKITGATTETMFGSIREDGKRLVYPMFVGHQMAYIPELMAFLGTVSRQDDARVSTFNEVLEGNEVTRHIIKFGNASQELIDEYCAGKDGLYFDGRSLRYTPNTCFVISTRPVDGKTFALLQNSGFWSRFHVIAPAISDSMAREIVTGSMNNERLVGVNDLRKELKAFNTQLMQKPTSRDLPAYESFTLPIYQELDKLATAYCEKFSVDYASLSPTRIGGDMFREANAYRILMSSSSAQVLDWIKKRAGHFFQFTVNPQIASTTQVSHQYREDLCREAILASFGGQSEVERWRIVDVMQAQGFKAITVDRTLKNHFKKSAVYGKYDVAP